MNKDQSYFDAQILYNSGNVARHGSEEQCSVYSNVKVQQKYFVPKVNEES